MNKPYYTSFIEDMKNESIELNNIKIDYLLEMYHAYLLAPNPENRKEYSIKIFNKYKKIFPFTINYPLWLIFIISLTPKIIFKMIALFTILLLKKDKKTKIINLFKTKI